MIGLEYDAGSHQGEGPPEGVMDLSEVELEDLLRRFELVVIDCWGGWCKHCRRMASVFDDLAKEHSGRAVFGRVDAQQHFHVPVKYQVRATPTFLLFRRGELVDRLVGEMSREELDRAVRRQLESISRDRPG